MLGRATGDDIGDIADYYDSDPAREHGRLERHQLEYDLTWRYLERYLPPQGSVLEIGAATGRYTLELAQRGYAVTAVDLSASLLEECRKHLAAQGAAGQVLLVVADACDLAAVTEKEFDAALVMGPLYHLVLESDRQAALVQVYERLRPGGLLFSSFISRLGALSDLLKDSPAWILDQKYARAVLETGRRPDDAPRGGFRGHLARASEIAPLHEAVGFHTVQVAGVEPVIAADDASYNRLEGRERELWLDLLYQLSAEPSILEASRHLLYIGKKK